MTKFKKHILLGTVATAMALPTYTIPASAQVDELVVTARKREESIQDVPLAISAFSGAELSAAGLNDLQELALYTPGISLREGFGRRGGVSNRPSIRGVGSIVGEATAGYYVDGIYVAGPVAGLSLDNLQRVEVVRGPQSAAYGRGALAGAINFVSQRPGNEFDAFFEATAGTWDHYEVKGFVSGPIIEDVLSVELNGRWYDFGGDYYNWSTGDTDIGEEETVSIGGKINFTPNENWDVFIDVAYQRDEDGAFRYGQFFGGNDRIEGIPNPSSNFAANADLALNCFVPNQIGTLFFSIPILDSRSRGYYCGEIGQPTRLFADLGGLPGLERETWRIHKITDWDIGDWTLSSLTGYTRIDEFQNVQGTSVGIGGNGDIDFNEYFSQELRLTSPGDQPIRGILGAYYYFDRTETRASFSYGTGDPFATPAVPGEELGVDFVYDLEDTENVVINHAVFGQVEWDLTERFTMSAEARYQVEKVKVLNGNRDVIFHAFLPRFTARYQLTDDVNLYANIGRGNKPGGFNTAYLTNIFPEDQARAFAEGRDVIEESFMWAYEAGVKSSLFDGMLVANAAVYYYDWSGQQLSSSDSVRNAAGTSNRNLSIAVNAEQSRAIGAELELFFNPNENWDFRFTYAYSDAELRKHVDDNLHDLLDTDGICEICRDVVGPGVDPIGDVAGNNVAQSPMHQVATGATYTRPLFGDVDFFLRADYSFESKRYVQVANLAFAGASHNINLRTGIEHENWTISLWGENVLNNDTPEVVTRILDFGQGGCFNFAEQNSFCGGGRRFSFMRDFFATAPAKARWGITASYRF